jgi:hypothetical protein
LKQPYYLTMRRIGIILAPTTFFMALYFLLTMALGQHRRGASPEEEVGQIEVVQAVSEDEELKNKRPKVATDPQLD